MHSGVIAGNPIGYGQELERFDEQARTTSSETEEG